MTKLQLNGRLFVNPDGHEWMRAKWSPPVRAYWRWSEKVMVKYADLIICDSINIEKYIKESYKNYNPLTFYIAYGADVKKSNLADDDIKFSTWLKKNGVHKNGYYLIVGRFVPENNYETMIREFMASSTKRSLVIITNKNKKLYVALEKKLHFSNDSRIKFVGTMYDKQLLKTSRS